MRRSNIGSSAIGRVGMLIEMEQQQLVPLDKAVEILERVLSEMPEGDRLPFLAHLEQKARQEADLQRIRVFRAYRAKHP
jgi:hypothetical protein